MHLFASETNDTTSRSSTGVTGGQGVGVAALSKIISAGMDNNGSANNGVLANELDFQVLLAALGNTATVGGDVTQVANVSVVVFGSSVGLLEGVEVRSSRGATEQKLALINTKQNYIKTKILTRWCCHRKYECGILSRNWGHCLQFPRKWWCSPSQWVVRRTQFP